MCSIDQTLNQLTVEVVLLDGTVEDSFSVQLPVADQSPLILTVVVIAGVAVVAVVLVLYIRKRR